MKMEMHTVSTSFGIDNPEDFVFYATLLVGTLTAVALLLYIIFKKK